MSRAENPLTFVQEAYSQDTGGGFECDILILDDGRILVISEEAIVLYKDLDAWESNPSDQVGAIYRPVTE